MRMAPHRRLSSGTWRKVASGAVLVAAQLALLLPTPAESRLSLPEIHGHLRYEGFGYPDPDHVDQSWEDFFELVTRGRGTLAAPLTYSFETLLVADDVGFTAGGFSLRNEEQRRPYFSLVSAALVYRALPGLRLSAGKKMLKWSIMDGIQPANLMVPSDQSDIFRRVDQGLYSLTVRGQHNSSYVELAVVPFLFTPVRLPQGRWNIITGDVEQRQDLPSVTFDETQAGLRLGSQIGDLEFTLFGYVGRDWAAVFLPNLIFVGGEDPLQLEIISRYPRLRSGGLNASHSLGESALVRVETVYFSSPDNYRENFFLTAFGAEYLWGDWLITGSYTRFDRTAQASEEVTDKGERGFFRSFLAGDVSYDRGGRWKGQASVGYDTTGEFLLVQAEVSASVWRDLRAAINGQLIDAWGEGYFDRIRHEDRLGLQLTYYY